jgi:hypothetical protein
MFLSRGEPGTGTDYEHRLQPWCAPCSVGFYMLLLGVQFHFNAVVECLHYGSREGD